MKNLIDSWNNKIATESEKTYGDGEESCDTDTPESFPEIRIVMKSITQSNDFTNEVNRALKDGFNFIMGTSDIEVKTMNGQDYFIVIMKK